MLIEKVDFSFMTPLLFFFDYH